MHRKQIVRAGAKEGEARRALIMLHGRGASAQDILSLSNYLHVDGFALVAPEATGHTWYPYSFLAAPETNEPWLSSAITLLLDVVNDLTVEGLASRDIYFLGFSQGACLALEFTTRYAMRYGGIVAFTGGLIGDKVRNENYSGNFSGTPVFIGTSNPDPHVPVERVRKTAELMQKMNALVELRIYDGMGHTINEDEITLANSRVFDSGGPAPI